MSLCEPNACGGFLRDRFPLGKVGQSSCLYKIIEVASVGPQSVPRTFSLSVGHSANIDIG